jgi:hypothetical protein
MRLLLAFLIGLFLGTIQTPQAIEAYFWNRKINKRLENPEWPFPRG